MYRQRSYTGTQDVSALRTKYTGKEMFSGAWRVNRQPPGETMMENEKIYTGKERKKRWADMM